MNEIHYKVDDTDLDVDMFLGLAQRTWPGTYDESKAADALRQTTNISAWDEAQLIGCVRLLSDGYFFTTIPELLVDPNYQGCGVGRRLMELAWEKTPSSLFFGAQPGKEEFYEKLGYSPSLSAFERRKDRNKSGA